MLHTLESKSQAMSWREIVALPVNVYPNIATFAFNCKIYLTHIACSDVMKLRMKSWMNVTK